MIVNAEVGNNPLTASELNELEMMARLGQPDPVMVLRLLRNNEVKDDEGETINDPR